MQNQGAGLFMGTAVPESAQVSDAFNNEPKDGDHEERLDRDEKASEGVEPEMIPTQRNTSYNGRASDSSGPTVGGNAIGKHASASSSLDFVGEMEPRGVSVRRGKEEFAALERRYSNLSQHSDLQRANTRLSIRRQPSQVSRDVEKQNEEEFDLAGTLRAGREKQDEAGIKHKSVGVAWDDLEVIGGGGMKINIRTFPNAIMEQFLMPALSVLGLFGYKPFAPKPNTILFKNSGVLKPGQMCLVLGRPGAGCSTFLKSISNQRDGFLDVKGDVAYAGVGWKEMAKRFGGEVVYNQEDDDHLPTLTVAQTIRFALSTKTPRKKIPGVTDAQFREDVLNLLLSMLNIKHTANTIVGNAFMRGVSGGERKRVSIAEMFCAGPVVASWDNSTRGLDASTALDYAKSLRLLTDIMHQTTFVSLYQAGEGIYQQFDKVLVLNDGHVVYYGPAKEARPYMIGLGYKDLPRQTSADYLTGCTDLNERQFADGKDADSVPSTPEAMEKAYRESDIYRREMDEKAQYQQTQNDHPEVREEFRQAVQDQKHKGVGKKSPYTVSFFSQVWSLAKRQTTLRFQDKFGIYTGYATSIIVALLVGSTFFQLPTTSAGVFSRGGVLFLGLLFNALTSFSELPGQMMGRPIIYRQVGYRFHRPAAYALAAVIADIPYNASNITAFSLVLYFMSGLYRSAGAFFTFLLFVFSGFMVMASFFRTLGLGCSDYNVAARLASVLISIMVTYAGYMIPVFAMKRWLFWLFYLNPLSYAYEALFANEFGRLQFTCDANYVIPRNVPEAGITGFPDNIGANQLCSITGATTGSNIVSGTAYMNAGYNYYSSHIWRNFGILLGFFAFFMILQMILIETLKKGDATAAVVVFKKEDKETKELNERLQSRKADFRAGKLEQDVSGLKMAPKSFTWSGLNYTVPIKGGQKQLLNDIWGYVKPGTLTALMGASGAGKTTLLDVLADRKTTGVVTGDIMMDGRKIDQSFQRGCGYAEQQDTHEWTATVREALRFSAYLRQPQSVPVSEKNDYVESIIELLELQDLADGMVGFPGFGLTVEARKRVTIGVELAAKPELLLFLDEPTSGLDGQSAYNIVRFLRKLTAAGQKILCTIHQPNALLFQSFDRLLLLQRGGETVYFGPIGPDSRDLIDYIERNGAKVPADKNPAEEMLDIIGAGSRKRVGGDWGEKWRNSPEFQDVKETVRQLNEEAMANQHEDHEKKGTEYATSTFFQFKTVLQRTNVALWRNADYQWTRAFAHIAIALTVSLTFLQLDTSLQSLQYRVFACFFATILPALVLAQIEPQYIMARMTFAREQSSKMYSSTIFAFTQFLAEMPYSVLCSFLFFILLYYPVGLPSESSRAGYFFFLILITEIYAVTLGQAVAALSPTIIIAALFNPFLLVMFSLYCGVLTGGPSGMPYFWRSWMYQLDPFTRLISGLVSSSLYQVPVVCQNAEFNRFTPPDGQTCAAYAGAFASAVGGYINNPSAVAPALCEFCQYSVGQSFYTPLAISFDTRWRDLGIFICYVVFNVAVLLLAARFLSYTKR